MSYTNELYSSDFSQTFVTSEQKNIIINTNITYYISNGQFILNSANFMLQNINVEDQIIIKATDYSVLVDTKANGYSGAQDIEIFVNNTEEKYDWPTLTKNSDKYYSFPVQVFISFYIDSIIYTPAASETSQILKGSDIEAQEIILNYWPLETLELQIVNEFKNRYFENGEQKIELGQLCLNNSETNYFHLWDDIIIEAECGDYKTNIAEFYEFTDPYISIYTNLDTNHFSVFDSIYINVYIRGTFNFGNDSTSISQSSWYVQEHFAEFEPYAEKIQSPTNIELIYNSEKDPYSLTLSYTNTNAYKNNSIIKQYFWYKTEKDTAEYNKVQLSISAGSHTTSIPLWNYKGETITLYWLIKTQGQQGDLIETTEVISETYFIPEVKNVIYTKTTNNITKGVPYVWNGSNWVQTQEIYIWNGSNWARAGI